MLLVSKVTLQVIKEIIVFVTYTLYVSTIHKQYDYVEELKPVCYHLHLKKEHECVVSISLGVVVSLCPSYLYGRLNRHALAARLAVHSK